MAVNLNHAVVQGYVVSIYEGNTNTKVTVVVRDDYKKNDQWIERSYFVPVTFFGNMAESLVRNVQRGSFITLEFKVSSYKPENAEFHTLSCLGISYSTVPNQSQDAKPSTSNNTRRGTSGRKSDRTAIVDEDDDWGDLPPWDKN